MRVPYSTLDISQSESDSMPWLPLLVRIAEREVETVGLVDSGATVNVLPYDLGVQLGAVWDDRNAVIQLYGIQCLLLSHSA